MPSEGPNEGRGFPYGYLLVLLAGAVFWPWRVVATNPVDFVRPLPMILVALTFFLLACAYFVLLLRLGMTPEGAALTALTATLVLTIGGLVSRALEAPLDILVAAFVLIAVPILAFRLQSSTLVSALVVGLAVFLIADPAIRTLQSLGSEEPEITRTETASVPAMSDRPDIVVVLLDSYPGLATWGSDLAHITNQLPDQLEARGFELPKSAWAAYPWTRFSFPSLLEMGYPVEGAPSAATEVGLNRIVSGDSAFDQVLAANGYVTARVGSGWSGFSCTEVVDVCADSQFIDEMVGFTLSTSIAAPVLFGGRGHAFTIGSVAAMDWVRSTMGDFLASPDPAFVLVHLMLPHEPLLLDEACEPVGERMQFAYEEKTYETIDQAELESRLEDQVACVNSFVLALDDIVGSESVLVVVSDHGFDRRHREVGKWDLWTMEERLNPLVAVRTGSMSCPMDDPVVLPNVLRRVLSCYTEGALPDLPVRMFMPDLSEIPSVDVQSMLANR